VGSPISPHPERIGRVRAAPPPAPGLPAPPPAAAASLREKYL